LETFGGISPEGPDGILDTSDDGEGEFILFQDEEDDAVGGFYNIYWDTDSLIDNRNLPGKGTYAVDIMFFDGKIERIAVDINDGGAFKQQITNTITPDPDDPTKGFREGQETSFILVVLKDPGEP